MTLIDMLKEGQRNRCKTAGEAFSFAIRQMGNDFLDCSSQRQALSRLWFDSDILNDTSIEDALNILETPNEHKQTILDAMGEFNQFIEKEMRDGRKAEILVGTYERWLDLQSQIVNNLVFEENRFPETAKVLEQIQNEDCFEKVNVSENESPQEQIRFLDNEIENFLIGYEEL